MTDADQHHLQNDERLRRTRADTGTATTDAGTDASTARLDDEDDREELRRRYYGLLEELRVILPGTQILVAFLLAVPFASGFERVDDLGRALYGVSLTSGVLAVIVLLSPAVAHRVGERRARARRLEWGIDTTRAGLVLLATSLLGAVAVVGRFVYPTLIALVLVVLVTATIVVLWVLVPRGMPERSKVTKPDRSA